MITAGIKEAHQHLISKRDEPIAIIKPTIHLLLAHSLHIAKFLSRIRHLQKQLQRWA